MVKSLLRFATLSMVVGCFSISQVTGQTGKKIKTIVVDAGHGGDRDPGAIGQYENSLRSKEKDVTLAIAMKLVAELRHQLPDVTIVPTRTTDVYQSPREKADIAKANKGDLFLCIHADSGPLKTGTRKTGEKEVTKVKYVYEGKGKKRKKIKVEYTVTVPIYETFKMPLTRSGTSVWIFAPHKTGEVVGSIKEEMGDLFEGHDAEGDDSKLVNSVEKTTLANIYAKRFQQKSDMLAYMVNEEVVKTERQSLGVHQRQVGIWVLQATNMPAILIETGFINNPEDERYLNSQEGQQELAKAITNAVKLYKTQVEGLSNTNVPANTVPENVEKEETTPTPIAISSRPVKEKRIIELNNNVVKIEILDDAEVDNDIVSVYFNKQLVVNKRALTAKAQQFMITMDPTKTNELIFYAETLGSIAPNTAYIVIHDGNEKKELKLSADFKNNASIVFELKPKK